MDLLHCSVDLKCKTNQNAGAFQMNQTILKPYITISLTDVCNMRCVYCPPAGENYHTPRAVFDLDRLKGVLRAVAALDIPKIRFTGGEPLLYPHLQEAMQYAANLELEIHINTNGLLLEKQMTWLHQITRLFIKVSLDAHSFGKNDILFRL